MKKLLGLLFLMLLLLAACGNNTPKESSTDHSETENKEAVASENENEEVETEADEEATVSLSSLASCEGILLEVGKIIEGKQLAACMADAMIAAGSGSHKIISSTGTTKVDFQWNPDFSMHVESEHSTVIVDGDTGWMNIPGRGWVEETDNPNDTDEVIASNVVQLTRALGHPIAIAENFAQSPTWHVIAQGPVPDADAFVDTAWHLAPEGPINLGDAILTDVQLWVTQNYLGAYYISTATISGLTDTTSNTFLQWGEPVDIPSPK
ncbi:hypothetical protein [Metasolibacillus sp.]|uniref:hypothetical protein n=1 Tax=Metasolibacillus sp. TaxID=2703680 RepID=UPI0025D1EC78|nr:hypothetical protein [Metasolibacillus sp.]MCT6925159.1 hypothetical protein [Metasolibacillus sp.]MCT6941370.1 hypothetical protein [Metasolibacillus sp.]